MPKPKFKPKPDDDKLKDIVLSAMSTAVITEALRLSMPLNPENSEDADLINGTASTLAQSCMKILKAAYDVDPGRS